MQKIAYSEGVHTIRKVIQMKLLSTLTKTGIVQLSWPKLYEPDAFKLKTDDKNAEKSEEKQDTKLSYNLSFMLDKENPEHMQTVKKLLHGQTCAMKNAVAEKHWVKDDVKSCRRAVQDCDNMYMLNGSGASAKKILIADKYPERAGHWYMTASRNAKSGRPPVYYRAAGGRYIKLPDPILNPKDDAEREEALRIETLWNKWAYPGQNAMVAVTFKDWVNQTQATGVSARLEAVYLIGGGIRLGNYTFDEIFGEDDSLEAGEWLKKNAPDFDPEVGVVRTSDAFDDEVEDADDDDFDEETGEILSPTKPKSHARKAKVSTDDADAGFDDEPAEEKPKRSARKAKPVVDEFEEDDTELDDVSDDADIW